MIGAVAAQIGLVIERKRAEERLRWSEEQLRLLLDSSAEGIFGVDLQGHCTFCNAAGVRLLGYERPADLLGREMHSLIAHSRIDGTPFPSVECPVVQSLQSGTPVSAQNDVFWRKDGRSFPVEYWSYPIFREGTHIGAVVTFLDITERKRAEAALRESEEKFSKVFASAPAAMAVTRPSDQRILDVNREFTRLLGYSREEVIGRSTVELGLFVNPEDRERLLKIIASDGDLKDLELHLRARDGSVVIGRYAGQLAEVNGEILLLSAFVDITARKRAEEEVRASREQLRALAGRLQEVREEERTRIAREIHDVLAQELTGLKIDLGWIGKRLPNPEVDRGTLAEKFAALSGMIDTAISTVQKIAAELRPVVLDSLGLSAAIEWQAEEFQQRTGIRCEAIVPDEDLPLSRECATGIFRIVQESLTNVIRHANATSVEIILEWDEDQFRLLVQDNGTGFDQANMKDRHSLGLLGMRERTLLLGGQFEIRGLPEKGTRVSVTIPRESPSIAVGA
jgi:PAS domain S-box-containing protein